jgi:putative transposase
MGPKEEAYDPETHTDEPIIVVLNDAQTGISVLDLYRKHGISDATFCKRRAKYSGLEVSDVRKLRQLEEENQRLKQMVAERARLHSTFGYRSPAKFETTAGTFN